VSDVKVRPSRADLGAYMPFNPLDPEFAANPYPHFHKLRKESRLIRTSAGIWYATGYEDVSTVLRDPRFGHGDGKVEEGLLGWLGTASGEGGEDVRSFFAHDPPEHTRLRGLVAKAFTPRRVKELKPRIEKIVDELLDDALGGEQMDVMGQLAYPLCAIVICELLGMPPEDRERFQVWHDALARALDPDFLQTPEELEQRTRGLVDFRNYFIELSARRRRDPGDDLLSALVQVEDQGDTLTETDLLTTCVLLVTAGATPAVNYIGNGLVSLLRNPDQLEYARQNLDRDEVFEELLRYEPSVQITFRIALEDVDLGGTLIRENELVIPVIGAANRDPAVFPDPDRLDLTRPTGKHIAFGLGVHFCIGAALGWMEGRVALTRLLQRAPYIALTGEKLSYKRNVLLRGLEALPVRLQP
jgi:cytochrome P450